MKKIAVIACFTNNIGDDIQTIAALRYAPDAEFVHRKNVGYDDRDLAIIGNAWWSEVAGVYPRPDQDILPISMHIQPELGDAFYEFLKGKTVGARDMFTLRNLQSRGIDAYFSGCLTLTLPEYRGKRTGGIVYTDNIPDEWIPEDGTYSQHANDDWVNLSIERRLEMAREKLDLYKNAELVITGRLHAALPCIAMGTPVLVNTDVDFDNMRFEGLEEYMNTEFLGFDPSLYKVKRPTKLIAELKRRVNEYLLSKKQDADTEE